MMRDFPGGPVADSAFPIGGPGSMPGQGTRSHMPQWRSKILQATSKTQHNWINK